MAIPNIFNVVMISLFFMVVFGILGVNYFKGQYFYCANIPFDKTSNATKWDCLNSGGLWQNSISNFDDIGNSILTLVHMSSRVGWAQVMYNGIAANGVD